MTSTNAYSSRWFALFMDTVPPEQTEAEVAFVERQLPHERFPSLLDVACGTGRHANALGARGYRVLGIDRDPAALARARRAAPSGVAFARRDLRELGSLPGSFDGALCLWQSFGYFEQDANRRLLGDIARTVRPGGRVLLDVYNRDFSGWHDPAPRRFEKAGGSVLEHRRLDERRLRVELTYDDGAAEAFDWELFTPAELGDAAGAAGLRPLAACTGFDERVPPSARAPRMQLVFERAG